MQNNKTVSNWDNLPVVLDINTVALLFGVTEVTIKHLVYKGELKATKLGKKWIFDKDYIIGFVKKDIA